LKGTPVKILLCILLPWITLLCLPRSATGQTTLPPLVPLVHDLIQPVIDQEAVESYPAMLQRLSLAEQFPASFKLSLVESTFREPWQGMASLEKVGLTVSLAAQSERPIAGVLDAFTPLFDIPAQPFQELNRGEIDSWQNHLQWIRNVLQESSRLRQAALAGLTDQQQEFLFQHAQLLVADFSAQTACQPETYDRLREDLRFFSLAVERIDWNQMAAAAKVLALLTEEKWLESFAELARQQPILGTPQTGIEGTLIWAEETENGWIIIGGPESNTYQLDRPVAVLIDIGGDDHYQGMVAANDLGTGVSIVIDLDGDDHYRNENLGLATGRLGVGILVDCRGNDSWTLADGSGGTGFAGLGILRKGSGNAKFTGGRWCMGAAMAGLGLLIGGNGNDQYQADIYSIGIGGPRGMGAVIDIGGDDHYRCGFRYGSGYNSSDAPQAEPGDPNYQYEGWGLGIGVGRRFYPWLTAEQQDFRLAQLAGGVGILIDIDGDDLYESSNFSLGCGYYFGAGLKLDLAGDDDYRTARYGNGAGAHQAIGLAIDYSGSDQYHSSGPTYHGGCAWDCSVFMCFDGGAQADRYQLQRTSGLGIADHGSFGVFADLGGNDRYDITTGLGRGGGGSLAVFLDQSGEDHYHEKTSRGNRQTISEQEGKSLFIDRE